MVQRYIWIGALSLSFCFSCGHVFAQKSQKEKSCGVIFRKYLSPIEIEKNKQAYIYSEEISIHDYHVFWGMKRQEYGADSEQYKSLIPDTVKFETWYGFPFYEWGKMKNDCKAWKSSVKRQFTFPMVAISYEQALAFCQWYGDEYNKYSKLDSTQFSLPTQADYEAILSKAKITQRKALSPLQYKKGKRVFGLTDNVAEYTQDGTIVEGGENTTLKFVSVENCENPIGFRYKAMVVSKK